MIRKLAELGIIVEAGAARLLEGAHTGEIIKKIKKMEPKPLVIDEKLAKKLLKEEVRPRLLKKAEPMQNMSISDFVAAYNERYAALQRILLKNPKLAGAVSIADASGNCAVIGMVKKEMNKEAKTEIEDPSGSLVLSGGGKLLGGDVAGVLGLASAGLLSAKEIVFPDVQLKEAKGREGVIAVGPGRALNIDSDAWYDAGGCIIVTSTANLSEVSKELGVDERGAAVELLRRRRLMAPPRDFLEPQPDILIFKSSESFSQKYKRVLVIGLKEGAKAEINLGRREAKFWVSS